MKKRQGAIFEQHGRILTFAEAFPDIETAAISIAETGQDTVGLGIRRFHARSVREYINCSNTDCSGKGLFLGRLLREMSADRRSHAQFNQPCEGTTTTGNSCPNIFLTEIALGFRGETA